MPLSIKQLRQQHSAAKRALNKTHQLMLSNNVNDLKIPSKQKAVRMSKNAKEALKEFRKGTIEAKKLANAAAKLVKNAKK